MLDVTSPLIYWPSVVAIVFGSVVLCVVARRHPGRWRVTVARSIGACLFAVAISFATVVEFEGGWSAKTSLPLPLCDVAIIVAGVACWWSNFVLVELTYFWGMAATLQGVVTPDLTVAYPHLEFFDYVVGHLGVLCAALFLVVGMGIHPRRGAVIRVFAITCGYTAVVGLVDAATGANYMFLRQPPPEWTLLRVLGPWPWYIPSAAALALVLLVLLNAPFWWERRRRPDGTAGTPTASPVGRGREES